MSGRCASGVKGLRSPDSRSVHSISPPPCRCRSHRCGCRSAISIADRQSCPGCLGVRLGRVWFTDLDCDGDIAVPAGGVSIGGIKRMITDVGPDPKPRRSKDGMGCAGRECRTQLLVVWAPRLHGEPQRTNPHHWHSPDSTDDFYVTITAPSCTHELRKRGGRRDDVGTLVASQPTSRRLWPWKAERFTSRATKAKSSPSTWKLITSSHSPIVLKR